MRCLKIIVLVQIVPLPKAVGYSFGWFINVVYIRLYAWQTYRQPELKKGDNTINTIITATGKEVKDSNTTRILRYSEIRYTTQFGSANWRDLAENGTK